MKVLFRCFLLLVAAGCSAGFAWADDEFLFLNKETKPAVVERHPGSAFSSDSAEAIPPGKQNSAESILPGKPDSVEMPSCVQEPACCDGMCAAMQSCDRVWTIDYRVKTFFDSNTTYQFGVQEYLANPYAPLSKLSWPLDSTWDGLRIGVEKPNWRAHFEWLTPMVHDTYRDMADYDWSGPDRDPASLSSSPERWTDGQSIELEGSFKLLDHILQAPIELWPVIGFRFQRFDLMAHDGDQIINDGTLVPLPPPVGYHWTEDMISFNQQYYMAYIGGQLRRDFERRKLSPRYAGVPSRLGRHLGLQHRSPYLRLRSRRHPPLHDGEHPGRRFPPGADRRDADQLPVLPGPRSRAPRNSDLGLASPGRDRNADRQRDLDQRRDGHVRPEFADGLPPRQVLILDGSHNTNAAAAVALSPGPAAQLPARLFSVGR